MPVKVRPAGPELFPVGGRLFDSGWIVVPGIVAGVAYVSGDAMGTKFLIPLGCAEGLLQAVSVIDLDSEQIAFDALLFSADFTATADNAAFDLDDSQYSNFLGVWTIPGAAFVAFSDNAVATVTDYGLPVRAPLRCQLVTRGVPNYTAATDLAVRFTGTVLS